MITSNKRIVGFVAAAGAAVIGLSGSATAQSVIGGQKDPGGPFSASLERRHAEQNLRALPQQLRDTREKNFKDPKAIKQMNEDFLRLQTIRANLAKKFAAGGLHGSPDLRDSAQEIGRRASRLRSMLVLSESRADIEIRSDSSPSVESINDRAFQLCLEISRFTENPMFRANGVITGKQVSEAAEALDTVIALAAVVRKESDRVH